MSAQPDEFALAELPETEQEILHILHDEGELPRTAIAERFDEQTRWAPTTVSSAGPRLQDRGLVLSKPNPAFPIEHIYALTERGRAVIQQGGGVA